MSQLISKPERPANDDCCGGGACCPCVWDYYYEQLSLWNEQQAKLEPSAGQQTADKLATTCKG